MGELCTTIYFFFLENLLKSMGNLGIPGSPENILEYSGLKIIENHSGPMTTSGPSNHKIIKIYSILNIFKYIHCRGYQ